MSQILRQRKDECYFHFIYSCPVCIPTIQALETYCTRPDRFYSVKSSASTFGTGLTEAFKARLYSDKPEDRLSAINALIQRWVERRFALIAFSDSKRTEIRKAIEEKRKTGMENLKIFKARTFDDGENAGKLQVSYYAPAFAKLEECAVCNAAVGKELKTQKPQ